MVENQRKKVESKKIERICREVGEENQICY